MLEAHISVVRMRDWTVRCTPAVGFLEIDAVDEPRDVAFLWLFILNGFFNFF